MKHTEAESAGNQCPSAETLTAYLAATGSFPAELAGSWTGVMTERETQQINSHLAVCDSCVEDLRTAQRRLWVAAEVPHAVPQAVAARAAAARVSDSAPVDFAAWLTDARRWLSGALRLPVLVPAAAAVTLLVVFMPRLESSSSAPRELSRAVPLRQSARVTASSTSVRTERHPDSEILANLRRGDQIVLIGEQDGWYRISLADGTEGWVERTAFE